MEFRDILDARKEAIVDRWLDEVLGAYPEDGAAFFKRGRDQFTNPVGHAARTGTRALFDALRTGEDTDTTDDLRRILKIRAVQEIPASTAVGFVLALKDAVRAELDEGGAAFRSELHELDGRIDDLALAAFDVYVELREELARIRIREMQRKVSWILERLNRPVEPTEPAEVE